MKRIVQFAMLMVIPLLISAQSVSPEVVASAGDYFKTADGSLSWTVGEVITETFSSGSFILTQGFQQPVTVRITMDLMVFLEGPYNGSGMNTLLNAASKLPLNQPYHVPPWNYYGDESVLSIPFDAVDWVLIELRDAINAPSAVETTIIARRAGFLMNDGSVVDINGSANLQFTATYHQNLYVVAWHRNHLGIMSVNPPEYFNGVYSYDFSLAASQVYGGSAGYKQMPSGAWAMVAGDGVHDGLINFPDKDLWMNTAGQQGYQPADYNMDVQVNNPDKNDKWLDNQIYIRTVP